MVPQENDSILIQHGEDDDGPWVQDHIAADHLAIRGSGGIDGNLDPAPDVDDLSGHANLTGKIAMQRSNC
jgi:hypothetical protein